MPCKEVGGEGVWESKGGGESEGGGGGGGGGGGVGGGGGGGGGFAPSFTLNEVVAKR